MTPEEKVALLKKAGVWDVIGFPSCIDKLFDLVAAHEREKLAEQEPFDMDDHPPHRLCECRKCMEYFTPLPDCDAFAASGKPIAEQEPVGVVYDSYDTQGIKWECKDPLPTGTPLYAAPVRTKDLTDDELLKIWQAQVPASNRVYEFARAVIAADREKNK